MSFVLIQSNSIRQKLLTEENRSNEMILRLTVKIPGNLVHFHEIFLHFLPELCPTWKAGKKTLRYAVILAATEGGRKEQLTESTESSDFLPDTQLERNV